MNILQCENVQALLGAVRHALALYEAPAAARGVVAEDVRPVVAGDEPELLHRSPEDVV